MYCDQYVFRRLNTHTFYMYYSSSCTTHSPRQTQTPPQTPYAHSDIWWGEMALKATAAASTRNDDDDDYFEKNCALYIYRCAAGAIKSYIWLCVCSFNAFPIAHINQSHSLATCVCFCLLLRAGWRERGSPHKTRRLHTHAHIILN